VPPWRRDPWAWFDFDLESDPTVHVPYRVHLRLMSGRVVDARALWVRISDSTGLSYGPEPDENIPLAAIASGHVEIVCGPVDLAQLRGQYAWAYRTWQAHEAIVVHQWIRDGVPAAEVADRLCRPPDHILAKAARVDALLRAARQLAQPVTPPDYQRKITHESATHHPSYEPRPWYVEDAATDPTVYVPCDIHLDLGGSAIDATPLGSCSLDELGIHYSSDYVRLDGLVSGRVELRPVPADRAELRETYAQAYQPWQSRDAKDVLEGGRQEPETPLARLVERLSRPPEHIRAKYDRQEAAAAAVVRHPRTEPAPYLRADIEGSGSWEVMVQDVAQPRAVADRHGIEPTLVTSWGLFLAPLTEEQIGVLRLDPDVENIEKMGWASL
jgi:hypothetical protein